jgi:hypothetical protein
VDAGHDLGADTARDAQPLFAVLAAERKASPPVGNDLLLAICEEAISRALATALPAYSAERRWVDRVRAGLYALLECIEREPHLALLCLVALSSGNTAARRRHAELMKQLARVIDEGRHAARTQPPPLTAEMVVAGAIAIVERQLQGEDPPSASTLVNTLMAIIVHPYLGSSHAGRELNRQPPQPASHLHPFPARPNPLDRWPIRLTYRTVRVLEAIDAQPGICGSSRRLGVNLPVDGRQPGGGCRLSGARPAGSSARSTCI